MPVKLSSGQLISDTDPNIEDYKKSPGAIVVPSPAPAPTPSRYTAPTAGTYETEASKYVSENANKTVDEEAIRQAKAAEAQSQIDAINKRFDEAVKAEKIAGVGYMGQTRSAAARGGLLGSDFGASQLATTEKANIANVEAVNAKRNLELAAVWDKIDTRASEEINKKTEQALKGRESYISWLKENRDEARTDFTTIAKTGQIKSLNELSDEDYKKLLDQTGYDEATAKLVFNANLPSAKKTDYQFKIEGNKLVAYGINPTTNEVEVIEKELKDNVPANYKPTVLPDGTLIFTPDKIDPNKDLKDQVIMYGAEGQFMKPKSTSGDGGGNENYNAITIPGEVKTDLLADINAGNPIEDVMAAYTDVNTDYIKSLYGKEETPKGLTQTDKNQLRAAKAEKKPRASLIADGYTDAEIDQIYGAGVDFTENNKETNSGGFWDFLKGKNK